MNTIWTRPIKLGTTDDLASGRHQLVQFLVSDIAKLGKNDETDWFGPFHLTSSYRQGKNKNKCALIYYLLTPQHFGILWLAISIAYL